MSPPIRDGSGNSIGSIRLGDGTEIAEVRTGAGDVLFSAIPESSLYHLPIQKRANSTIDEVLENENATSQRTTNTQGDWWRDYAEDGDGGDNYIKLPSAYRSWLETTKDQWFILTVDTSSSGRILSVFDGSGTTTKWAISALSDGSIRVDVQGDDGNRVAVETISTPLDGTKKRVGYQRTGEAASSFEIWVDGSQQNVTEDFDQGGGWNGSLSTTYDPFIFARNDEGSANKNLNSAVDNIIFGQLGTTLTSAEFTKDYNNQPWS